MTYKDKYDEEDLLDLYLSIKEAHYGIMQTYGSGTEFIEACYDQVLRQREKQCKMPLSSEFEKLKDYDPTPRYYHMTSADIIVYFLELELKDLPLYINAREERVQAVVKWRLKVGA